MRYTHGGDGGGGGRGGGEGGGGGGGGGSTVGRVRVRIHPPCLVGVYRDSEHRACGLARCCGGYAGAGTGVASGGHARLGGGVAARVKGEPTRACVWSVATELGARLMQRGGRRGGAKRSSWSAGLKTVAALSDLVDDQESMTQPQSNM